MKFEIIYYELKKKEFRSKKSMNNFLNTKLDSEILRVAEFKKGLCFLLELNSFLQEYKYNIKVEKVKWM